MNKAMKDRKAKAGLLLVASPRFKNLSGPKRGTYGERKDKAVKEIMASLDFLDLVWPGITYEREDAEKAMSLFYNEKVDFVLVEFLSWSEDFAWIRFLRDMPEIPVLFTNVARDRMTFETTLDEDDFVDYLCAGTLVGSLEASGSVRRVPRKNVKVVMGTRAEITEKVRVYARAAKARAILRPITSPIPTTATSSGRSRRPRRTPGSGTSPPDTRSWTTSRRTSSAAASRRPSPCRRWPRRTTST